MAPPRIRRAGSGAPSVRASKKPRTTINPGSRRGAAVVAEPVPSSDVAQEEDEEAEAERLKQEFLKLLSSDIAKRHSSGLSNKVIKQQLGPEKYVKLVPVINEMMNTSKLIMSRIGDSLFYKSVSDEIASKFIGLDVKAKMVYQVIEKAGNMGVWTKDIRTQTNIQQQALNKIFKTLEGRQLIKPVKSVTAKSKKMYMLYDLVPAKELTGGPWYTELEFDHEFITELRNFVLHCVRRLNGGKGVTMSEISEKMAAAKVSRVQLNMDEVQQLMQTLAYDFLIEQASVNGRGEGLFVAARKVTSACDFKWWDALSPDFHFRNIRFEDGVVLQAHEPHHHTSS